MHKIAKSYFAKMPGNQKGTFFIFLLLLIWRMILIQLLWPTGAPYWWESAFICIVYSLITITLWLNKEDLQSINIDKGFIVIFIALGGLYSLILPPIFRLFLAALTIFNISVLWLGTFKFGVPSPYIGQTAVLIAILLIPHSLRIISSLNAVPHIDGAVLLYSFFVGNPPLAIFEEVIYRGLLWMFLKNLKLNIRWVIVIQALFFWLSHISYYSSQPFTPITFWFYLPVSSILLGMIVWRSKSIGASSIGHILYNFLAFTQ